MQGLDCSKNQALPQHVRTTLVNIMYSFEADNT